MKILQSYKDSEQMETVSCSLTEDWFNKLLSLIEQVLCSH